jgi:hypothetical protein
MQADVVSADCMRTYWKHRMCSPARMALCRLRSSRSACRRRSRRRRLPLQILSVARCSRCVQTPCHAACLRCWHSHLIHCAASSTISQTQVTGLATAGQWCFRPTSPTQQAFNVIATHTTSLALGPAAGTSAGAESAEACALVLFAQMSSSRGVLLRFLPSITWPLEVALPRSKLLGGWQHRPCCVGNTY